MAIRNHNFSGIEWYYHGKKELIQEIEWSFNHHVGAKKLPNNPSNEKMLDKLLGIVSPHAGYSCSGPHASHGYLEISNHKDIDSVIILGTNHTGMGVPTSLFPKGEWITPLGTLKIDDHLHDLFTEFVRSNASKIGFAVDQDAHIEEHSIDNQLPFLQYSIQNEFTILPITMGDHSLETCRIVADILAKIIESSEKKIIIVASSDFTHYLSPDEAKRKDSSVLDYLLKYELEDAVKTKKLLNATICGFGPVVTLFKTAVNLNMNKNKLLLYGHSGETCGDSTRVVAYSSIILGS